MEGSAFWMRVSSLMTPSLIGTLKSTRMMTRLPASSTSLRVFLFMCLPLGWMGAGGGRPLFSVLFTRPAGIFKGKRAPCRVDSGTGPAI